MSHWHADEATLQHDVVLKKAAPAPGVPSSPETLMERLSRVLGAHMERLAKRDPQQFLKLAHEWRAKRDANVQKDSL